MPGSRRTLLESARSYAATASRDASLLFQAGRHGYLPVLDANRSLLAAEQALAAQESKIAGDQVQLFLALGGTWNKRLRVQRSPHRHTDKGANMETTMVLYHEDVQVGQRFSTGTYQLQQDEIIGFASHHDPQPFHLDPELAKGTLFGGLAGSGWQTAAISMKLMVEGGLQLAGGMIGAHCELDWPAPTRPGDILHVEGEVIEVAPVGPGRKRGTVTMRSETKNQHGTVVQVLIAKLVVQRRPE